MDRLRANAGDLIRAGLNTADAAKQAVGTRLGNLTGTGSISEGRHGEYEIDRLADVHTRSTGTALVAKLLGSGTPDAEGPEVILGRVARGEHDKLGIGFYERPTSSPTTWASTTGTFLVLTERTALVIPGNGAQSLIEVWTWCEVRAQAAGVNLTLTCRITASNVTGNPGIENFEGALGRDVDTPVDTNWHAVCLYHAARFAPATDLTLDSRLIRLIHTGTASPANLIGSAWGVARRTPI